MRTKLSKWLLAFLTAAAAVVVLAPDAVRAEPVAIVVDRDNPKTDISVEELKSLFLGKKSEWSDGTRAVPIDQDWSPTRVAFSTDVLHMAQADVENYWVDQKVRGGGAPPKLVSSALSVLKLVAKVRGAVGYVPMSQVDGSVKVLQVNGAAPGAPNYPLK